MFARITSALFALSLAATVFAGGHNEVEQCNGGTVQCCNSVQRAESLDFEATKLVGLLHLDVKQITGQLGFTCSPVTVIGAAGGSSCSQQKVCCTGNNYNGLVVVGCTPINVSL